MKDDPSKRRLQLQQEIEKTEASIKAIDADKQKREARKLNVEEDIRTKSKILSRPIIEKAKPRKKKKEAEPKDDGPSGEKQASPQRIDSSPQKSGGYLGSTGVSGPGPKQRTLRAPSLFGMLAESVNLHMLSALDAKDREQGLGVQDYPYKMRVTGGLKARVEERMIEDLKQLEGTAEPRLRRVGELSIKRHIGTITPGEKEELQNLQKNEATRYYIREKLLRKVPLDEQDDYKWLNPVGAGAHGVMPYTVLTTWDLMGPEKRKAAKWHAYNQLLRWQTAVLGQYLPKKPSLAWFKESKKKGLETLFDDWNEELYSDKKWAEMVKKGQAQLEKFEEELTGYDAFTVSEEAQMKKMLETIMATATAEAKEAEMYN
jgi:hypothetical protein